MKRPSIARNNNAKRTTEADAPATLDKNGAGCDDRSMTTEDREGGLFTFIAGAAIGAFFGILLAPRAGRESRDKLTEWLKERREKGAEWLETARAQSDDGSSPVE